jgi:hypothetical protein
MNFIHQSVHSLCQAVKQGLRQWTAPTDHAPVLNTALDLTRSKLELVLENALLRQQLIGFSRLRVVVYTSGGHGSNCCPDPAVCGYAAAKPPNGSLNPTCLDSQPAGPR